MDRQKIESCPLKFDLLFHQNVYTHMSDGKKKTSVLSKHLTLELPAFFLLLFSFSIQHVKNVFLFIILLTVYNSLFSSIVHIFPIAYTQVKVP